MNPKEHHHNAVQVYFSCFRLISKKKDNFHVRNLKSQDGSIADGGQRYLEDEVPSKKSRVSEL